MRVRNVVVLGAAAAAVVMGIARPASAADTATAQWTGGAGTTWSTGGNWTGGVAPGSTLGAKFDGAFTNMPLLTGAQTAQGIWMATGVGQDVTIDGSGAQMLTLGSATLNSNTATSILLDDSASHNLTFGPNITIAPGASTSITNNSGGKILIQGALRNAGGAGVTIKGSGVTEVSGSLINAAGSGFTKTEGGTLILSGASTTYNNTIAVNAGILRQTHVDATKAATVNLSSTGTIQLRSDVDGDTFTSTGITNITNTGTTINVDQATAGSINKTLGLGKVTVGNGAKMNVTGGNGYNLSVGAMTLGNGNASASTLNPTSANLTVASVTNVATAGPGVTQTLGLDGTSTGNAVIGAIANAGGGAGLAVSKTGASTWTLQGSNSFTGNLSVTGGTLRGTHSNALGFGGAMRRNETATATVGGATTTLDLAGNITVNKPLTLQNGASLINSAAGATAVLDSGLASVGFTNGGTGFVAADVGKSVSIGAGGTGASANISALSAELATISGIIGTGTGWVTGNTITLQGGGATQNAVYSVTASGGQITALTLTNPGFGYTSAPTGYTGAKGGAGSAFAGSTLTPTYNDSFAIGGISTTATGNGYVSVPSISLTGVSGTGAVLTSQISSLTINGTGNKIGGDGNITINAPIGGTGTWTKIGNGLLTINGFYAGTTNVSSGTLGGSGLLSGPVNILAGANLAPGNSPGILGTGNLSIAGTLIAEALGTAAGSSYDQVNVTGSVTLDAASALTLALGYAASNGDAFTVVQNDGADAVAGTFATINGVAPTLVSGSIYGFDATYNAQSYHFEINYAGGDGNDIVITTAVPEPGAMMLALGAAGAGCLLRKRRSVK